MIQSQAPVCDTTLGKLGGPRNDCPRRTEMMRLLHQLFSSDFLPHGTCYLWNPRIVWLHVISDAVITLPYYCIPIALVYLARRRRGLPFNWIFCELADGVALGTKVAVVAGLCGHPYLR